MDTGLSATPLSKKKDFRYRFKIRTQCVALSGRCRRAPGPGGRCRQRRRRRRRWRRRRARRPVGQSLASACGPTRPSWCTRTRWWRRRRTLRRPTCIKPAHVPLDLFLFFGSYERRRVKIQWKRFSGVIHLNKATSRTLSSLIVCLFGSLRFHLSREVTTHSIVSASIRFCLFEYWLELER